jgi:hypothetical protein
MTDGFEFEWLTDLRNAEPADKITKTSDSISSETNEDSQDTSDTLSAINDPDRYEEGGYPLPFTDWHPAPQTYEPESEPAAERDPYEHDDDAPAVSGDLENFVNDVGEFISDPIGSVFRSLFG